MALIGDQFKADGVLLTPPAPETTRPTHNAARQAIPSLELEPQYSSDFTAFTKLQKEIDDQCLRYVPESPVCHHN